MTSTFNFKQLQKRVAKWNKHNFPNKKPHQPLLGAVEEIGELSHAHLKEEQGIRGNPIQHKVNKKDAIADCIIFLADYCEQQDFDMQKIVEETWKNVERRDWIKFPTNGLTL